MVPIINTIAESSLGGGFVDWTINYLSGKEKFYGGICNPSCDQSSFFSVVSNPLDNNTSHKHKRNTANNYQDYIHIINTLDTVGDSFHTLHSLLYDCEHKANQKMYSSDMINSFNKNKFNIYINAAEHSHFWLYLDFSIGRDGYIYEPFKDELDEWNKSGNNEIWDKREVHALCKRPFNSRTINPDLIKNKFDLNIMDLFNTFDSTVYELFNYLELQIDSDRFDNWSNVYHKWRLQHTDRLRWVWYFDQIMESIVNGYSMDLTRFNIDLFHEATIQHVLIYKYDLNLKTFGLKKFPKNTKDLHNLLEKNIHNNLKNLY